MELNTSLKPYTSTYCCLVVLSYSAAYEVYILLITNEQVSAGIFLDLLTVISDIALIL